MDFSVLFLKGSMFFFDFCYFIWEDTVIFNIKHYRFPGCEVFITFILVIRCSTQGTVICENTWKAREGQGGSRRQKGVTEARTALTMGIELAVILSRVTHILCPTEGMLCMAHLNLANLVVFENSYQKSSVDLFCGSSIFFIILSHLLLMHILKQLQ